LFRGGEKTPHFVILGKFTQKRMETIKALPENLKEAINVFKSYGVKMNAFVFTMGRYDFVGICEAPNTEAVSKAVLSWGSEGLLRTETMTGFTGEEMSKLVNEI
jgi:uncharacterized protein with GYD domain